ncbi:hypothetical protein [Flavilitoribacter nigricans]|uniref:Uncharacterized protein n=1 Tax=Flavilitoribacter nigricans (strain ATCC 23147 / DSM 23189 / NBRC 102662 / NCIMB 1420 / SS-2) TaxID=1122177 RepID=A0A2D0NH06_FLAN2|nr:hypothetical protein [Flavilitoribacter nigricans]PHN07698.1 hypothetical protein CRP01_06250 [Flavilitoribacter nigricans DSM 23189 = NBRC 102662]
MNPIEEATTNSITLSPDMSTLYLIDNNRAIPFDLNNKNGIVVGTLDGQLTVATALPVIIPPQDKEDPTTPEIPDDDAGNTGGTPDRELEESPIRRLAISPRYFKISTLRKQFTLMFNKELGVLSIIGASDIDTSIIGASDIDTSIIGASDIDTSIARNIRIDPDPEDTTDTPQEFDAQGAKANCYIYSFRITKNSINIKRAGGLLIIQY